MTVELTPYGYLSAQLCTFVGWAPPTISCRARSTEWITSVIEIFTGCTLSTTAADFFNGLEKSRENQNLVRFLATLDYRCLLCRLNVQSKAQNLFEKSSSLLKSIEK